MLLLLITFPAKNTKYTDSQERSIKLIYVVERDTQGMTKTIGSACLSLSCDHWRPTHRLACLLNVLGAHARSSPI